MAKIIGYSKLKHYWKVYFFIIPSVLLVGLFSYYPALSAMYHAFFRWNGEDINTFIGDLNFRRLMGNYWLWIFTFAIFALVLFYSRKNDIKSNLFRLIGGIGSMIAGAGAIAINGWAYIDMTREAAGKHFGFALLVWGTLLLVFKFFVSDENKNKWIYLLIPLDFIAAAFIHATGFSSVFSWMIVMLFNGFFMWILPYAETLPHIEGARTLQSFIALGICFWGLGKHAGGDPVLWSGFTIVFILVLFNIPKMIPSIATAVVIHRLKSDKFNYLYKVLFVIPMIIPGMVYLLLWKFFFEPNVGIFNKVLIYTKIMDVLVYMDGLLGWGGIFKAGTMPVWLGNEHLVLPAFILWGFPWVGVTGVLIYLAGLQGISTSVYEAADIDGANAFEKFFHIELPLILTQIRINMVLMIISTLQAYGFILILFGESGGPNGKLMVPGLLMFAQAFSGGQAGYACAIGLILFFFILLLTELNNRYIRVDK